MSIDEETKKAIQQVARAKVAEAMGGDVIGQVVQNVMDHKERLHGSRNERTVMDKLVFDGVEQVLRQAVAERLSQDDVQAQIKTAVASSAEKLVTEFVAAFAEDDWRANLEIKFGQ